MSDRRDEFFDDEVGTVLETQEDHSPPVPARNIRRWSDVKPLENKEDPTTTPRSPPSTPQSQQLVSHPEPIPEVYDSQFSSRRSSISNSFKPETIKEKEEIKISHHSTADVDIQTDRIVLLDESIQTEELPQTVIQTQINPTQPVQTEIFNNGSSLKKKTATRKTVTISKSLTTPLVKTLFDQTMSAVLPIISFCQPFSMTSRVNDIILAMPRHLMIINNQNSVSVYPWQQSQESTSTILECHWCSFLYKLLVTTLEGNRLFIYDFISIIDTIKLRGYPLSIKHQSYQSQQTNSSFVLPPSSRHQPLAAVWSQTRFTKSNSFGIYYCYISDRHHSCMLTRIDHNTRQHIKSIDCSGGSINNNTRVCAMGLSDEQVAVVLTNLIMTFYDAQTLVGLKQINLSRSNGYDMRGVSAVLYLWKTWLVFDPIENKVVGIGKQKRQFVKMLPEQPINACSMDNGTLSLWLGYPGALLYYRLIE